MSAQRIVQIPNEVILVALVEAHEGPAHDDEFHLVDAVSQPTQLGHPPPRLRVGIVSRAYGPHRSGLVSGVGLGRIFEVAVGPAGTVDADPAGHGDVRTAMGFAHHRHDAHAAGGSDGLLAQVWQ